MGTEGKGSGQGRGRWNNRGKGSPLEATPLKGGFKTYDKRLDLVWQPDERNKLYRISDFHQSKKPRSFTWSCDLFLDQGNAGSCVGNGITHELAARPAPVEGLNEKFAVEMVYWPAQKLDRFPGGAYPGAQPFAEGTSIVAGAKAARALGYFDEFRWMFDLTDMILGVGHNGPAVLGINWYEGMMDVDKYGFVYPTGRRIGGHCVLCVQVNIKQKFFVLKNSWSREWGWLGCCKISFDDMNLLIEQGADGVFFMHRHNVPHSAKVDA